MPIGLEKQEENICSLQCLTCFRWLVAGTLLAITFFSILSIVNAATLTAGDLGPRGNPDGQLDAGDLLILQQFVLGTQTPTGNEDLVADIAPLGLPDGQINAGDVVLLMRAINGLVTLPPVVTGPDAPVLDAVSSPTSNNPQTITGTATPNTEVRLYVNSAQQDSVMSDAGGLFSFQAILFDGINSVHATTWDGVDESGASNELSVDYVNTTPRSQGGTITQDTVWTPGSPNDPYVINANLTIANGASLILLPGTEVQFPANYTFQVDGELIVLGSVANPVVLTSSRASPAADNWQGIVVSSTATRIVIEYAEIRYADRAIEFAANTLTDSGACDTFCVRNSLFEFNRYGFYLTGASPWIESNLVQDNTRDGIYMQQSSPQIINNTIQDTNSPYAGLRLGSSSHPVVTGNEITGFTYGIYSVPGNATQAVLSLPVVNGNAIYGNSSYNVYAWNYYDPANTTLDMTGNWWGTTDPAVIAGKLYDSASTPVIDFSGYLDGFPGNPVVVDALLGPFTTDTTLVSGTTYEVLGDLTVPAGVKLTIEAGVTLRFNGGTYNVLTVDGELEVLGTAVSPVVFTSGQGVPAVNDWQGIYIASTATQAVLEYVEVRYARRGIEFAANTTTHNNGDCDKFCVRNSVLESNEYGLYLTGASPWIESNLIQGNSKDGLNLTGSSPQIEGNMIQLNGNDGIDMVTSSPQIINNTIQDNASPYMGIRMGNASHPVIMGNEITGHYRGIQIVGSGQAVANSLPVITGNAIYGSSDYNLHTQSYYDAANVTLDATGNWWGLTNPATIAGKIYDHVDAVSSPVVDFSGYLDGFPGNPVMVDILQGVLATSTTLVSGTTYEVLGDLMVPAGVKLTIEAGVTLRFNGGTYNVLTVDGELEVLGTAVSPVVFTSGQGAPAVNDWQGIYIASTATQAVLEYVEVRYARRGIEFAANTTTHNNGDCDKFCVRNSVLESNEYGLYLTDASPWIESNLVQGNSKDGLNLTGSSPQIEGNMIQLNGNDGIHMVTSSPQIVDNTIQNNASPYDGIDIGSSSHPVITGNVITGQYRGIQIISTAQAGGNSLPVITGNAIYGNSNYNLYTSFYYDAANVTLDVTGNWWGTDNFALINEKIYDHADNTSSPVVDVSGYLDAINGNPVTTAILQGDITTDTTLLANTTYDVNGTLRVVSGVTLTVEEGVTLRFNGATRTLLVEGTLLIQGTAANPAILTSGQPDPANGDWGGIRIATPTSNVVMEYADISYANYGIEFTSSTVVDNAGLCNALCVKNTLIEHNNTGLYIDSASPWIERNIIQYNLDDGIYIKNASPNIQTNTVRGNGDTNSGDAGIEILGASNPQITNGNLIKDNKLFGIYVHGGGGADPAPVITGNSLFGNSNYDFFGNWYNNPTGATLDLRSNWWGTTEEAAIAAQVYDNTDTSGAPLTDTSNFVDQVTAETVFGLVQVLNVTQNQTTLQPLDGEVLDMTFDLAAVQANVRLRVLTEETRVLIYESIPQLLTGGQYLLSWNGLDSNGNHVPDEAYVFEVVAAYDGRYDESAPIYPNPAVTLAGAGGADDSYNAYINDFFEGNVTLPQDSRFRISVTPAGGQQFWAINTPLEAGTHTILWDGRDPDGNIVSGTSTVFVPDYIHLPSNTVIVKGNLSQITGTGLAPDIEVKSNPWLIMHSYDQISRIIYNLNLDSTVTVKLLPPGITDINSASAIVLVNNLLQDANDGGGQPMDHTVEWLGYDVLDTNDILVDVEGTYTFVIQATGVQTGLTSTYRGALQLYR